jgi:hypothetical protein
VLPAVGFTLTFARIGRRMGTFAWQRSESHPRVRVAYALAAAAAIGLVAFSWWPNGEYRPIQPSEKGTLSRAVRSLKDVGTGRPSLTAQRAAELNGAPAESARFPGPKDTGSRGNEQGGKKNSSQSPADDGSGNGQDESGQTPSGQEKQSQQGQQQTNTPKPGTQTAPEQQQTTPSGTPPSDQPPAEQPVEPPTSTTP